MKREQRIWIARIRGLATALSRIGWTLHHPVARRATARALERLLAT